LNQELGSDVGALLRCRGITKDGEQGWVEDGFDETLTKEI